MEGALETALTLQASSPGGGHWVRTHILFEMSVVSAARS